MSGLATLQNTILARKADRLRSGDSPLEELWISRVLWEDVCKELDRYACVEEHKTYMGVKIRVIGT